LDKHEASVVERSWFGAKLADSLPKKELNSFSLNLCTMARSPEAITGWRQAGWTSRYAWRRGLLNSEKWKQFWSGMKKLSQASLPDKRKEGFKDSLLVQFCYVPLGCLSSLCLWCGMYQSWMWCETWWVRMRMGCKNWTSFWSFIKDLKAGALPWNSKKITKQPVSLKIKIKWNSPRPRRPTILNLPEYSINYYLVHHYQFLLPSHKQLLVLWLKSSQIFKKSDNYSITRGGISSDLGRQATTTIHP
jgi:hypothetical protein